MNNTTKLTKSERTVLLLAGRGLSAREIGERLELSARTVEFHQDNARRKMGVTKTFRAFVLAQEQGLLK